MEVLRQHILQTKKGVLENKALTFWINTRTIYCFLLVLLYSSNPHGVPVWWLFNTHLAKVQLLGADCWTFIVWLLNFRKVSIELSQNDKIIVKGYFLYYQYFAEKRKNSVFSTISQLFLKKQRRIAAKRAKNDTPLVDKNEVDCGFFIFVDR